MERAHNKGDTEMAMSPEDRAIYDMELHIEHLEKQIDLMGNLALRVGTTAQKAQWRKLIVRIAEQDGLVMGHENVPYEERGNQ
jgi:hypothetical protein